MSLPTYATYYDKNDKELYEHFINVGWFLTEDLWIEAIHSLPKIYGTFYITLYCIRIPIEFINNEPELRNIYQEDQEDYRRKRLGLTKKELETKDDPVPVKEKTLLSEQTAFILPMVRSLMPSIIAHDIIGVQPMTEAGQIFKMRYTQPSKYRLVRYLTKQYGKLKDSVNKYIIFVKSFIEYITINKHF